MGKSSQASAAAAPTEGPTTTIIRSTNSYLKALAVVEPFETALDGGSQVDRIKLANLFDAVIAPGVRNALAQADCLLAIEQKDPADNDRFLSPGEDGYVDPPPREAEMARQFIHKSFADTYIGGGAITAAGYSATSGTAQQMWTVITAAHSFENLTGGSTGAASDAKALAALVAKVPLVAALIRSTRAYRLTPGGDSVEISDLTNMSDVVVQLKSELGYLKSNATAITSLGDTDRQVFDIDKEETMVARMLRHPQLTQLVWFSRDKLSNCTKFSGEIFSAAKAAADTSTVFGMIDTIQDLYSVYAAEQTSLDIFRRSTGPPTNIPPKGPKIAPVTPGVKIPLTPTGKYAGQDFTNKTCNACKARGHIQPFCPEDKETAAAMRAAAKKAGGGRAGRARVPGRERDRPPARIKDSDGKWNRPTQGGCPAFETGIPRGGCNGQGSTCTYTNSKLQKKVHRSGAAGTVAVRAFVPRHDKIAAIQPQQAAAESEPLNRAALTDEIRTQLFGEIRAAQAEAIELQRSRAELVEQVAARVQNGAPVAPVTPFARDPDNNYERIRPETPPTDTRPAKRPKKNGTSPFVSFFDGSGGKCQPSRTFSVLTVVRSAVSLLILIAMCTAMLCLTHMQGSSNEHLDAMVSSATTDVPPSVLLLAIASQALGLAVSGWLNPTYLVWTPSVRRTIYCSNKRTYSNKDVCSARTTPTPMVWVSPVISTDAETGFQLREYGSLQPARTAVDTTKTRLVAVLSKRKLGANQPSPLSTRYPCFDSGAGLHCSGNVTHFTKLAWLPQPKVLYTANNSKCEILAYGDIVYQTRNTDGELCIVRFKQVAYAPALGDSFYVNTTELRRRDWLCNGTKHAMTWTDSDNNKLQLSIQDEMEVLEGKYLTPQESHAFKVNGFTSNQFEERIASMTTKQLIAEIERQEGNRWENHLVSLRLADRGVLVHDGDSTFKRLHHALAHPSARVVARHAKKYSIPLSEIENHFCEACLKSSQRKRKTGKTKRFVEVPPPLTHFACDVFGPVTDDVGGPQYILLFCDFSTDETHSYPLKHLRDIPGQTRSFLHTVRSYRAEGGTHTVSVDFPMKMTSDSASYFKGKGMEAVARECNTHLEFSWPDTQARNGRAERYIGLLANRARALIIATGLTMADWWRAWLWAEHVANRTVRNGFPGATSPLEKRTGTAPPDITVSCPPFGAICSVWKPSGQRKDGKMSERARLGVIVGWCTQTHCPLVRVKTPTGRTVIRATGQIKLDPRLPPGVYRNDTPTLPDLPDEEMGRPAWLASQPDRAPVHREDLHDTPESFTLIEDHTTPPASAGTTPLTTGPEPDDPGSGAWDLGPGAPDSDKPAEAGPTVPNPAPSPTNRSSRRSAKARSNKRAKTTHKGYWKHVGDTIQVMEGHGY